jgi:hypothetical protein
MERIRRKKDAKWSGADSKCVHEGRFSRRLTLTMMARSRTW